MKNLSLDLSEISQFSPTCHEGTEIQETILGGGNYSFSQSEDEQSIKILTMYIYGLKTKAEIVRLFLSSLPALWLGMNKIS